MTDTLMVITVVVLVGLALVPLGGIAWEIAQLQREYARIPKPPKMWKEKKDWHKYVRHNRPPTNRPQRLTLPMTPLKLPPPSSEDWVALTQPLRIELARATFSMSHPPPEREPERWSDIRLSRSGPFTLKEEADDRDSNG